MRVPAVKFRKKGKKKCVEKGYSMAHCKHTKVGGWNPFLIPKDDRENCESE